MSDTPRTDKNANGRTLVSAEFARELERENARLRGELTNIANAKPSEWGEMSDQFQEWAQNRARHALANVEISNARERKG